MLKIERWGQASQTILRVDLLSLNIVTNIQGGAALGLKALTTEIKMQKLMEEADELKSCDELLETAKNTGEEEMKQMIKKTTTKAKKIQEKIEKEHLELQEKCGKLNGASTQPTGCSEEFEKKVEKHLQKLKELCSEGCLEKLQSEVKVSLSPGHAEDSSGDQEEDSKSDSKPQPGGQQDSVTPGQSGTSSTRAGASFKVAGCPEILAQLKRNLDDKQKTPADKKIVSYYELIFDYYFTQKKKTLRPGELSVNSMKEVQTNDAAVGQIVLGDWTTLAPGMLSVPKEESDIEEDCRKGILQAYAVTWERLVEDARTAAVGIVGLEGLSATEGWSDKDERFQKDRDSVDYLLLHDAVNSAVTRRPSLSAESEDDSVPPLLKALYNMKAVVKTVHDQLNKEAERLKSATSKKTSVWRSDSLSDAASLYTWLKNSLDTWIPLAEACSKPWWKKPLVLIGGGLTIVFLLLLLLWFFLLRKKEEEDEEKDDSGEKEEQNSEYVDNCDLFPDSGVDALRQLVSSDASGDTDDDFSEDGQPNSSDDDDGGMWWRPDHHIGGKGRGGGNHSDDSDEETDSEGGSPSSTNQNGVTNQNANGVSVNAVVKKYNKPGGGQNNNVGKSIVAGVTTTTTTTTTNAVVTGAAKNTTKSTGATTGPTASATLRADTQKRDRTRALLD